MEPFIFIYRIYNCDKVVVDLTGTNVKPSDVMSVSKLRPTDYILKDYPDSVVTQVSKEYLTSRGWLYIKNLPVNIYMAAEIERICRFGRDMVKKNDLINKDCAPEN